MPRESTAAVQKCEEGLGPHWGSFSFRNLITFWKSVFFPFSLWWCSSPWPFHQLLGNVSGVSHWQTWPNVCRWLDPSCSVCFFIMLGCCFFSHSPLNSLLSVPSSLLTHLLVPCSYFLHTQREHKENSNRTKLSLPLGNFFFKIRFCPILGLCIHTLFVTK